MVTISIKKAAPANDLPTQLSVKSDKINLFF